MMNESKPKHLNGSPADRAALTVLAVQMQEDPKKQGKEKKPDVNLVSLVFPAGQQ